MTTMQNTSIFDDQRFGSTSQSTSSLEGISEEALRQLVREIVQHLPAAGGKQPEPSPASGKLMEGLTPRMQRLRDQYLKARPSVSIYRALAFTEVAKNNPGLPTDHAAGQVFSGCLRNCAFADPER